MHRRNSEIPRFRCIRSRVLLFSAGRKHNYATTAKNHVKMEPVPPETLKISSWTAEVISRGKTGANVASFFYVDRKIEIKTKLSWSGREISGEEGEGGLEDIEEPRSFLEEMRKFGPRLCSHVNTKFPDGKLVHTRGDSVSAVVRKSFPACGERFPVLCLF